MCLWGHLSPRMYRNTEHTHTVCFLCLGVFSPIQLENKHICLWYVHTRGAASIWRQWGISVDLCKASITQKVFKQLETAFCNCFNENEAFCLRFLCCDAPRVSVDTWRFCQSAGDSGCWLAMKKHAHAQTKSCRCCAKNVWNWKNEKSLWLLDTQSYRAPKSRPFR